MLRLEQIKLGEDKIIVEELLDTASEQRTGAVITETVKANLESLDKKLFRVGKVLVEGTIGEENKLEKPLKDKYILYNRQFSEKLDVSIDYKTNVTLRLLHVSAIEAFIIPEEELINLV